jgi:very-short-patch-repair endonuclease
VRRGVLAPAAAPATWWEPMAAAVLAAGPEAALSHTSAAALHRMTPPNHGPVELTTSRPTGAKLDGIVVHRRPLQRQDVELRRGLRMTTPTRTLVDIAGNLSEQRLANLLDDGLVARRWTVRQIQECLARTGPRVAGRALLTKLVAERAPTEAADSRLELKVLGLLGPLRPFVVHHQVIIRDSVYVLDVAWPECRVAAEIDGRKHRLGSRQAFDRDRRKLNALGAAGWRVAHLTSNMSCAEMLDSVRGLVRAARGFG